MPIRLTPAGEITFVDERKDSPEAVFDATPTGDRMRDIEFLSLMAHDLRQPLSVVMGMAVSLENQWLQLDDEQRRKYIGLISRSATWMKSIVDDLLIAGASVNGRANFNPVSFSLASLVEETVHGLEPRDEGRLSLYFSDGLPNAFADPVQQRQVVQNLVGNAVKYSEPDTPILVGIAMRGSMLSVTVADRGLGIPVNDIPTIFEKFTRVVDSDQVSGIEGSGLGLYVCKAIVNAQGGEIDMEQNTGEVGSIFTYTLPIA